MSTAVPVRRTSKRSRALALAALVLAVGGVAFAARLSIMVRGGGISGLGAYDDGVYYAAADALVHGRLPYRDFLFLQPPLIAVVTAPFAWLGTLVGDPTGFKIARLAYMLLGACNAVLVAGVLRRWGWTAALVGGFGYAVFHPAIYSERSVLLEPLGTCAVLVATLLLEHAERHPRLALLAGVAAGLGVGAKIWYLVPALVLILMAHRRRLRYLLGLALGGCAIFLPFFLPAPARMWQQVVLNQLGRGGAPGTPGARRRVFDLLGAERTAGIPTTAFAIGLGVVALVAVVVVLRTRGARTFAVLLVATSAVLLAAPSWFSHYEALTAPPLALCIGVATGRLAALVPGPVAKTALVVVVVACVLGTNLKNDLTPYGRRIPPGLDRAAAVVPGCITGDDPGTLISMDVLSRNLRDPSCTVWPDVTGWTYDPRDFARAPDGEVLDRKLNTRWQRDLVAFMTSGDAAIRTRGATGWSEDSKRVIDSGRVLFRLGRYVVHETRR
ncbi:glycosyltransferase 87 family protein [Amnibacterium setariae]|nr:glycosyltransferase 87 family protein [Amnibacterium setariae]